MIARIARRPGTCGADGCLKAIWPGHRIVKPQDRAWRHENCDNPGRRSRADRDAERASAIGSGTRPGSRREQD